MQGLQLHQGDAEDRTVGWASGALPCSLLGGGVGGPWSCAGPICSCDPLQLPSPSYGVVVGGPWAQVVVVLRGSAGGPLPGGVPAAMSGWPAHVLLVVIIRSHRVQDAVDGLPAERARGAGGSPLPDAAEAEGVAAGVGVGGFPDGFQADGAASLCCCFR